MELKLQEKVKDATLVGMAGVLVDVMEKHTLLNSRAEPLLVVAEMKRAAAMYERVYVREARKAGASWEDIGGALGISKQAAAQRFSKLVAL